MLSISRSGEKGIASRKRNTSVAFKFGPMTLSIMTIAIIGFMALFYVVQASMSSEDAFQIHSLEAQGEELREKNRALETEASQLRALDSIEHKLQSSQRSFVPVSDVITLTLPDEAVAVAAE